jgi:hypothetical protein
VTRRLETATTAASQPSRRRRRGRGAPLAIGYKQLCSIAPAAPASPPSLMVALPRPRRRMRRRMNRASPSRWVRPHAPSSTGSQSTASSQLLRVAMARARRFCD